MRAFLVSVPVFFFACGPMVKGAPDAGGQDLCNGPAKTPANLIENGGFECDLSPAAWAGSSIYGTFEIVDGGHSGRAGKVTVNAGGGRMSYAKDFAVDAGMKSFCFSAFLSGTAPFMRMRVLAGGTNQEVDQSDQIFSDWRRLPLGTALEVPNNNATKLQLVFEVQTNRATQNALPGDTMLIDDVDVWESSTHCMETR